MTDIVDPLAPTGNDSATTGPSGVTERRIPKTARPAGDARVLRACLLATGGALIASIVIGCGRAFAQILLLDLNGRAIVSRLAMNVTLQSFFVPVVGAAMAIWTLRLRPRARTAGIVAIVVLCLLAEPAWVARVLDVWHLTYPAFWRMVLNRSDTNLIFALAALVLTRLAAHRAERERLDRGAAAVRELNADAQLYVMALQLHPHFLFNALNLASQLAFTNVDAALETLANLRTLLARSLELARQREVPLREELAFLESYTSIQARRFRDRLTMHVDVAPAVLPASVPHLTLQPLVENAIAHGLAPVEEGGTVSVRARRVGRRVQIAIEDSGVGVHTPIEEGTGLGITRRRLAQVFDADFTLAVENRNDRGARTIVDIPFRAFVGSDAPVSEEGYVSTDVAAEEGEARLAWQRIPFPLRLGAIWMLAATLWIASGAFTSPYGNVIGYSRGIAIGSALLWATLSLIPLAMAKWIDLTERVDAKRVWLHVVAAVATSVLHLSIWFAPLASVDRVQGILQRRARFAWFVWDLMAYASVIAVVWVGKLGRRMIETRRQVRRLRAELDDARLAAVRLRSQPAILFRALDAAADAVRRTPEAAELAIARLGDLLRMLLRASNREYVSAMEEYELIDAYLKLTADDRRLVLDADDDALIPATLTLTLLDEVARRTSSTEIRICVPADARPASADTRGSPATVPLTQA